MFGKNIEINTKSDLKMPKFLDVFTLKNSMCQTHYVLNSLIWILTWVKYIILNFILGFKIGILVLNGFNYHFSVPVGPN